MARLQSKAVIEILAGQKAVHGWQHLPMGFFKVNCDAAVRVDGSRWRLGAAIRDHTAFTAVVSLDGKGERSVTLTEATAFLEGLRLAADMGIQSIKGRQICKFLSAIYHL